MVDLAPSAPVQGLKEGDLLGCVLHQDIVFGKQSMGWICTVLLSLYLVWVQPSKWYSAGQFVRLSGYIS